MAANDGLELTGSSEFSIPDLVRLAGEGSLRIPKFQRSFVWDAADVRRLFDSIYRGFPIGTLLLWRREAPADNTSFGPINLHAPYRTDALWVVDGQQRVISLYGALAPDLPNKDERFEVYFDLSTKSFVNPRRGVVQPRAVPLRVALETRRLAAWTRQNNDDLEADDFDLADTLVGVIRDYRIRAYVVAEDDEVLLREVFDRVNSAGKPITRAQVFHALFASDTIPGSPSVVVKELQRLKFGSLDENRVVQSLLALRGGDVLRDFHDEFSATDDPYDWYDRTERALTRAIDFLRHEGVPHISLMPYTLPLPVLAAFFYLHQEPQPWVLQLLARWLWRIWVHGEIGQTSTLRRAVRAVNPKRLNVHEAPTEYDAVKLLLDYTADRPAPTISLDGFRTDSSQGRLIMLALASLRPLWPDGTEIDLATEFEKHGPSALTILVRRSRSNAATRALWPREAARLTGAEDPRVLHSHGIDQDAAECYRRGDIDGFIRHRSAYLASLLSDFVESHIEHRALIRAPLDELIVAELDDSD
jgi:Protein of unknown function DUF262